jgi:DNA-directed RNA polymerase specialized sigma24 family protein
MNDRSQLTNQGGDTSSSPRPDRETLADFMAVVRPFQRLVYLVAFACTKSASVAECVAVNVMAHAFQYWSQHPTNIDGLKVHLIRAVMFEARAHIGANSALDSSREVIDDLFCRQGTTEWQPIALDAIQNDAMRSNLTTALQELSAPTAVTLLLRDAFHFSTLKIADLIGESHQRVQARLAYGRIATCIKLAKWASDRENQNSSTFAAAY